MELCTAGMKKKWVKTSVIDSLRSGRRKTIVLTPSEMSTSYSWFCYSDQLNHTSANYNKKNDLDIKSSTPGIKAKEMDLMLFFNANLMSLFNLNYCIFIQPYISIQTSRELKVNNLFTHHHMDPSLQLIIHTYTQHQGQTRFMCNQECFLSNDFRPTSVFIYHHCIHSLLVFRNQSCL